MSKTTQIINRIASYAEYEKKMTDYKNHIKLMIGKKGQPIPLHVMIVSGDKGVGKTYQAEQILSKQNVRDYEIVTGSLSAVQLYKFLWEHSDAIIVLDDVNSILQDSKDGASLLKACTDSYHSRKLCWQKMNRMCMNVNKFHLKSNDEIRAKMDEIAKGNEKLAKSHEAGLTFPDTFFFTGAIIILTNKPLAVIDRVTEGAVSNRGWHQEMLFNAEGAVDLLKNYAKYMKSFNNIDLSQKSMNTALKFLTSEHALKFYKLNEKLPTLRTLGKVAIEVEYGNHLDEDTIANNCEAPAY